MRKTRISIAESELFQQFADKHLTEEKGLELISYLSVFPESGKLIKGTGGLRKLRWGSDNKGKRGGCRIIYYYFNSNVPLYILYGFRKGEMEDLSEEARSLLSDLALQYQRSYKA